MRGIDAKEPLARYLKTYSVFILDHTSKEDRFFNNVKQSGSLSTGEERALSKQFERLRHDCGVRTGSMIASIEELEKSEWYA
jgi:hypothetical protein